MPDSRFLSMLMSRTHAYAGAIREAARALAGHPLRAALGALSVTVAVATVASVLTGLDGFARYARTASARAFGSDTFVLARLAGATLSRREIADKLARNRPIRRADVRFLERFAAGQVVYAPSAQRSADVTAGGRKYENAAVNGTAAALFEIRDLGIERGRFIRRDEEERAAQVAVIGADVADALFPGVDPVGRTVRIARRGFQVIGVQARQGTAGGVSLDRYVSIPLQAFERVFGAPDSIQIFARGPNADEVQAAEDRARLTLRARRQLGPNAPDDFDLLTPEAARSFALALSERVGAAAAPISIMALLAAIVVVTNTSLVSVTRRTREIGMRRAIGARRSHIIVEVVAESSLMALAGGVVGLLAAQALVAVAAGALGQPLSIRPATVAWSLGAAGVSGLVAGWYPARRAARIDVITATRAE
jgi:putative ABC transport system permease protein